jgi:HD-like signal output (HDOD) protein
MSHLQTIMSMNLLTKMIKKIESNTLHLASLPDMLIKVNEALDDDRKTMRDIAEIVQHDTTLSMRLIQIANSPALRSSRKVTTVYDAVNRLGIGLVKNLAMCIVFTDSMNGMGRMHTELMRKSLALGMQKSAYGCIIAKYVTESVAPEVSLVVGLASQVGEIATIRFINDDPEFNQLPVDDALMLVAANGPLVCEIILQRWDLSSAAIDAIFNKDEPNLDEPESLKDVYATTNAYLAYLHGDQQGTPLFTLIDDIVAAQQAEVSSLVTLFK